MKCLPVSPIFAEAIVRGWKDIENRGFATKHRGRLAIYATKQAFSMEYLAVRQRMEELEMDEEINTQLGSFEWWLGERDSRGFVKAPPKAEGMDVSLKFPTSHAGKMGRRLGMIVGSVEIADVVHASGSPWAVEGQRHWLLRAPIRFSNPVPCPRVYPGMFDVPDSLILEAR